jgi:hypothetical protein
MPKRRDDAPEKLRFRSMLATLGSGIVDHRLFLQLAVVMIASVALLTWGPDGVRDSVTTFTQWAPVRQVSRVSSAIWGVVLDALRAADREPLREGAATVVENGSAASKKPLVTTPEIAAPGSANSNPAPAMTSGQSPGGSDPLQAVRTTGSSIRLREPTSSKGPPPDPPDAILWTLEKDGEIIRAEMHDRGKPGVDLQLFRNGKLWRSERWADRASSKTEAQVKRAGFEKIGWTKRPA